MDFHVRSDSVDVEQIMGQIRGRIREKRGADYTEAELQHLASVKLEKFLDSRGVRSTLVEAFKKTRVVEPELESYTFTDATLYETHRGWLRPIRKLFKPILHLFFNPDRVSGAFMKQQALNRDFYKRIRHRDDMDPLYYEVIHNLVLEITRLGIDVQNLKMRVESLSSRLDFDERRAKSLEGMVQRAPAVEGRTDRPQGDRYPGPQSGERPQAAPGGEGGRPAEAGQPATGSPSGGSFGGQEPRSDESRERRRRRRRRRRRPGQNMGMGPQGQSGPPPASGGPETASTGNGGSAAAWSDDGGGDDGSDDGGPDDGAEDNGQ